MSVTEVALRRLEQGDALGARAMLLEEAAASDEATGSLAHHATLGMVLLATGDATGALAALRTARDLGAIDPVTRLNHALAEARAGDPDCAAAMLHTLAGDCPDWAEPPLRLAELARSRGDREVAENAYRTALDIDPGRPDALVALGALLLERGDGEAAKQPLKRCCALAPENDQAWDALGLALLVTEEFALAEAAFHRARRLRPERIDYALHEVEAAVFDGRTEDALIRLDDEAAVDPLNVAVLTARGEILTRLGRREQAIDLFEAATTLAPTERVPAAKLAMALSVGLRQHEAEPAMRRALALDPDNADLGIALSVVLLRLQRHVDSRTLLQDLVDRFGEDAALLCNLATVSLALGLQSDACEQAARGIALAPHHAGTWRTLANTLPYCADSTGASVLQAACATARKLPRREPPTFANVPDPDRRLRIGLLSGTLKVHPVGWLTIAGFEALDTGQFELICFSQQVSRDVIAQRFYNIAANHDVFGFNDLALARFIEAEQIDILIDLGGYGDFGRMAVCAHRAAPVQMKWVGMQNGSTGLAEMDWIIADRWEIPDGFEPFYTERPLRLADGYVVYSPPAYAPDVAPLPALARGHVTFGCYNNLSKLTPAVIAAWADILGAIPDARLVLKTHQFSESVPCEYIRDAFRSRGITSDRLTLRGASPHRALLSEYGDIDIVLDPFPYNGGLTTCEALWMGVPVVTCPGEFFAARHSFSHLSNVGLTDWIAPDLDSYRALAIAKASDIPALAALRLGLRATVKASPLCDGKRFGASLGTGLRLAWRDWCESG